MVYIFGQLTLGLPLSAGQPFPHHHPSELSESSTLAHWYWTNQCEFDVIVPALSSGLIGVVAESRRPVLGV
jgi:hypothetical protein